MLSLKRIGALMCVILLLLPAAAAAARATATPPVEPEATLSPDAAAYDKEHPEELDADQLYAWSAILIEQSSGNVIFEKSADDIRYPASTTKIMTVYLALTMLDDLDQEITCSETATEVNRTYGTNEISTLGLQTGEVMSLRDLVYGTMIMSANDGANVLAEAVSGSIPAFVDLMNRTAQMMGCTNTHFANPHGLHDDAHYTTPRDMAVIAREAMKLEDFRDIVSRRSYSIPKTNMHRARTVNNTNELFNAGTEESPNRYYYPDATGMKTGYTDKAQYCFVGSASRDDLSLISVVMYTGRRARWADTIKLMDYGFSQYISISPQELYNENPVSIETSNYALDDTAMGRLKLNCVPADGAASLASLVVTKAEAEELALNLRTNALFQYTRDFSAPIAAGEVIGTMTYFLENGNTLVYNLTAARSVPARENVPKTLEQIRQETEADTNLMPRFSLYVVMRLFLPLVGLALVLTVIIRFLQHLRQSRHYAASRMVEDHNRLIK